MSQRRDDDNAIGKMFEAARRVDEATAPDFDGLRTRKPRTAIVRSSSFGWAVAATVGALMLGGALWALRSEPLRETAGHAVGEPRETASRPEVERPVDQAGTVAAAIEPLDIREAPEPAGLSDPVPEPPVRVAAEALALRHDAAFQALKQNLPGGIAVTVVDPAGNPLPGATVTISHDRGALKARAQLTGERGGAVFPTLRPGTGYAVDVAFPGFAGQRFEKLRVAPAADLPLTVQLEEPFSERIAVRADVEPQTHVKLLAMAPGVIDPDTDGNPNVHGSRDRDFQALVSGVSNVDPLTGALYAGPTGKPSSSVQTEILSSGAGAEYGRAVGGFASIVARGGSAETEEAFPGLDTETYTPIEENDYRAVTDHPLSTFSVDVDTASYANVRRFLVREGRIPPADAVRIEEMVNYFSYDYPQPVGDDPFSVTVEIADCPWNAENRLARIGLKGREVTRSGGSNLVFLIDVSGSMDDPYKLPLLKDALALLAGELGPSDRVAIVVYAGASGLVLPSTSGSDVDAIFRAIDELDAGGSTNGGAGLRLAYKIARENFIEGGVNRVILATDGDFNVGLNSHSALMKLVKKDADRGVFLTTLGFGMGNYKDARLERLADEGNGNHAYIDSLREACKELVEEINGTLVAIAKDVKIQVEFNPQVVGGYRLIGYENRMLAKEDFNDDERDAGEIGSGHTVTALYELTPPGSETSRSAVDELRYQTGSEPTDASGSGEAFTVKLRYKEPEGRKSRLIELPVTDEGLSLDVASEDFRFAAAVAGFGMVLRDSAYAGDDLPDRVRELASEGLGADPGGYRAEFLELVERAAELR